jgi:hypothetical protein
MESDQPTKQPAASDRASWNDEIPTSLPSPRFQVTSVEKATMPSGTDGDDWYRYVLASGRSQITGYHRGTHEEVSAYAETCAEEFNVRNATGKSARPPVTRKSR